MAENVKQGSGPAQPSIGDAPGPAFKHIRAAFERPDLSAVPQQTAAATARKLPVQRVAHTELQPSPAPRRLQQHLSVVVSNKLPQAYDQNAAQSAYLESQTKRDYSIYIWFAAFVLLPIALASVYFGFIASNQYVAEFRFSVQDASMPSSQSTSGIISMIGGGAASSTKNFMVTDYLTSQHAVEELQKRLKIETLYSKPEIDWWSRFNHLQPIERFLRYWQGMVTAQYDMITGIATAEVRAFSPQDALLIANTMVTLSEELVNKLANRSQQDTVRFAQQEVDKAQARLKLVRTQLTAFRNKFGVIDPTTSVAASNSSLIQTQRANLSQLETQVSSLELQHLKPNAPAIVALKNQIKSTKEQLAKTEADVGISAGGSALSTIVGNYEQINLEVQFAQAMVTSTMQALDQARANAAAQHLYITPYVRPSLPESSTYPRRFLSIAMVGALAFAVWLIGLMLVRSIRERFA